MRQFLLTLVAVAFVLPLFGGETLAQTATVVTGTTCPVSAVVPLGVNQSNIANQTGALCVTDQTLHNDLVTLENLATPSGLNNIGNVGGFARGLGGWNYVALHGLTNAAQSIKNNTGQLGGIQCFNNNAAATFLQLFDVALPGSATVGSPTYTIIIAANSVGGLPLSSFVGVQHSLGIQVAAATAFNGSTAPTSALECTAYFG